MRKIRFKNYKLENIFRNIICNIIIVILLFTMFLFSFKTENYEMLQASNSEYNGTIYAGDKNSNKIFSLYLISITSYYIQVTDVSLLSQ